MLHISGIEITPAKYAIVSAGESVMFTCVVIAKEGVNLKWRKHAADYTESNKNYVDLTTSAQQDDYDPDNNSRKSTLTLSSLAPADDSDSIECYEENTPALTATMELNVVGKITCSRVMSLLLSMLRTSCLEKLLSDIYTFTTLLLDCRYSTFTRTHVHHDSSVPIQ